MSFLLRRCIYFSEVTCFGQMKQNKKTRCLFVHSTVWIMGGKALCNIQLGLCNGKVVWGKCQEASGVYGGPKPGRLLAEEKVAPCTLRRENTPRLWTQETKKLVSRCLSLREGVWVCVYVCVSVCICVYKCVCFIQTENEVGFSLEAWDILRVHSGFYLLGKVTTWVEVILGLFHHWT